MTPPDNSAEARAVQADRYAAALLYDRISNPSWDSAKHLHSHAAQHMIAGHGDSSPFVQALAKHRLTFSAEQNTGGMPGRDAATEAAFRVIAGHDADPFLSPETWAFAEQITDAILALAPPTTAVEDMREAILNIEMVPITPPANDFDSGWDEAVKAYRKAIRALPVPPIGGGSRG